MNAGTPRILWFAWLQGIDTAPPLVKRCLHSWQCHNSGWQIIVLDGQNLNEYVDVDEIIGPNRQIISMQALTNIIRINLLANVGGVWADATCFCCRPLDDWIGNYLTSGFFAFEKPARDRLISSWFLASREDCHLTQTYCRHVNAFWRNNSFLHQTHWRRRVTARSLGKILYRNASLAGLWVHPLTVRVLRVLPYHWFHYIFYRIVTLDETSGEIWRRTPKLSADGPHRLQIAGLLKPPSPEIRAAIDGKKEALYKLDWRCHGAPASSTLAYLFRDDNTHASPPQFYLAGRNNGGDRYV